MTLSPKLTTPPSTSIGAMREWLNTFPWVTLNHSTVRLNSSTHAVLALCKTPHHLASGPLGSVLHHGGMRNVGPIHWPSCMPLGMRRSTYAPDHAPYSDALSGTTTPPYVKRLTLPTYGPLPSGAWVPEPLLFPLSGMGLALQLPQRVVQTCFCGLSSPTSTKCRSSQSSNRRTMRHCPSVATPG